MVETMIEQNNQKMVVQKNDFYYYILGAFVHISINIYQIWLFVSVKCTIYIFCIDVYKDYL